MFFADEAIARIRDAALDLMETTGLRLQLPAAVKVLQKAGAATEGETVRIPRALVEVALASSPSHWTIYDKAGESRPAIGTRSAYYGTADVAIACLDCATREKRPFVLEDTIRAGKLLNALPNIDFVCPFGTPMDVDQDRAAVIAFEALAAFTEKPVAFVTQNLETMREVYEIAARVCGELEYLVERPFLFTLLEPASPLIYPKETLEKLLWLSANRLPFLVNSAVSLGGTATVTVAGALVLSLAEELAAVVVAQLHSPGCPIGIGASIGALYMKSARYTAAGPEYLLGNAGFVEITKSLGLPAWTNGLCTQSKVPDAQAAIEAFSATYIPTLAGADVVYDAGYLESGQMSSLEMVTMVDEIGSIVRRLQRGIEVNDETIALDVIKEVGPGGAYLTNKHTARRFRKELWSPTLMDWDSYGAWDADGRKTFRDRAAEKISRILENETVSNSPVGE